jgi:phosphinothricin acetyltransferase
MRGRAVSIAIRPASKTDAEAIAAIYRYHVLNGTASYEIEPPSVDDTKEKIESLGERGWPFLVAEESGKVVGYAYATQFRDRAAYRFACEDSIYVAFDKAREGIGRALLETLMERSSEFGFRTMVAVVGGAEPASIALHERCGFVEVGRLSRVGFKLGRWLDSVYLQRDLPGTKS